MAKINFNHTDDLDQLQEYGVKIKTRHKKKRQMKIKRPSPHNSKSKRVKRYSTKYE